MTMNEYTGESGTQAGRQATAATAAGVPAADVAPAAAGDSFDDELQRLRQNSASVVAIPAPRTDGTPRLSPMQATLSVFAAWGTLAAFDLFSQPAERLAQLIVSVLLVLALSAVHELGHVFAGGAVGLRLVSCSVGPLSLVKRGGRYALDSNPHWIRFAGCVEHDIPRGTTTRTHLTISAIGGPIANLLLAAVLYAVGGQSVLVRSVALWSLVFGLINAIPLRMNGQTSDGGLVWRLWSTRPTDVTWRTELLTERRRRPRMAVHTP